MEYSLPRKVFYSGVRNLILGEEKKRKKKRKAGIRLISCVYFIRDEAFFLRGHFKEKSEEKSKSKLKKKKICNYEVWPKEAEFEVWGL